MLLDAVAGSNRRVPPRWYTCTTIIIRIAITIIRTFAITIIIIAITIAITGTSIVTIAITIAISIHHIDLDKSELLEHHPNFGRWHTAFH